ncbi:MAG: branched-chain amino acid ABC transporter permease [Candidatus Bathyarchaeia archaeon]
MIDPTIISAIIYANCITLLSIGFTLTYMTSRIPNFAQGTLAMVGACISLMACINGYNPYWFMPVASIIVGAFCFAIYKVVLSVLKARGATEISLTISTLAIEMLLYSLINIIIDVLQKTMKVYLQSFSLRFFDFSIFDLPGVLLISTICSVSLIIFLNFILTKSKFGIAMRAAVENPFLAEVLGVDVDMISAISWLLTGCLSGFSGSLLPLWFHVNTAQGITLLITIFAASVLGGFSSIQGAIIGGYLVGFSEIFLTYIFTRILGSWVTSYRPLFPLAIMIVMLLVCPTGVSALSKEIRNVLSRVRRREK